VSAEVRGLDAPAILAIFESHQVEYVVVGGYAANLHGSTRVTTDIDVTPNRTHANLARLAAACGTSEAASASTTSTTDSRSTPRPSRSLGCSP
jgi:hypothetical protein